ncbi:ABC transporter substrate-binding protein [Zobellella sp. An-6]|uniref:ABC transporter substrate-binding protein n=1 Tax=Zobellella sp. An-6 TaxID=3400218 RepID=UPI0040432BFF
MPAVPRCFAALLCLLSLGLAQAATRTDIRVELQLEPPHLDPTLTASATTAELTYANLFQGLTRINHKGEVVPALARAWRVSDDGLVYHFTLATGVSFHDGSPFNAEIAKFSLDRLRDPANGNPQQPLYSAIEQARVRGEHELELHLTRADSLLPFKLGLSAAVMVHPDSADNNRHHPVGTGPYRFSGRVPGQGVSLEYFPGYWGAEPSIKGARFTFTSNFVELEASLSEGLIDHYSDASTLVSHAQLRHRSDYLIRDGIGEGEILLAINNARPPFDRLPVRRALAHAIDKQAIRQQLYRFNTPPLIGSHFSPYHPAYVELSDYYPHDREKARRLLQQAGVPPGTAMTITIPPTIYAAELALLIASELEAIGLELHVERISWPQWMEQVFTNRDYELTIVSHIEPMDIGIYARDHYYFNYHNDAFKSLWRRIEQATAQGERHRLLADAQRMLAEDAVNVFLLMKPQLSIHKSNLRGTWVNTPVPAVVLEEMSWE